MPTILTIDDSPTIQNMLLSILLDAGFDVVQAGDGLQAVVLLESIIPDVVF